MSATEFTADALTRHQVYIQRLASGEVKRLIPFAEKMLKEVNTKIVLAQGYNLDRLIQTKRDLTAIVSGHIQDMGTELTNDVVELGEYSADYTENVLNDVVDVDLSGVTPNQIHASITSTKMALIVNGKTVKMTIAQAINQFAGTTASALTRMIQSGIAQGLTTTELANRLSSVVRGRTVAQAEALIRTSANHAAAQARKRLYEENSDIIEKEEFVATLDGHTTITCSSNDGKFFKVGQGLIPPLHFNCRSVRIPIVFSEFVIGGKDFRDSGTRPSIGSTGVKEVGSKVSFNGWMRRQPAGFQNEYFRQFVDGAVKASLFRKGGLTLEKFTNAKGIEYTLAELRKLEAAAFKKIEKTKAASRTTKTVTKKATKTAKPVAKLPTSENIKVTSTAANKKKMTAMAEDGAADKRYILDIDGKPKTRFRPTRRQRGVSNADAKRKNIGKANLTGLTDEASSVLLQTTEEANAIAKLYGVQPLRGVKVGTQKGAAASMGDGMLSVKKDYFNKYASTVKAQRTAARVAQVEAKLKLLDRELEKMGKQLKKMRETSGGMRSIEAQALGRKYNKKIDSFNRHQREFAALKPPKRKISKWKVGDKLTDRPHTVGDYFEDNVEELRNTVYHEMGHQIHQQYRVLTAQEYMSPPLEDVLAKLFNRRTVTPSRYAETNQHEWFAESFSLFHMGRSDLIDPLITGLLEAMQSNSYIKYLEVTGV